MLVSFAVGEVAQMPHPRRQYHPPVAESTIKASLRCTVDVKKLILLITNYLIDRWEPVQKMYIQVIKS